MLLSGKNYEISYQTANGNIWSAVIVSTGGALRVLQYDGKDITKPFGEDEVNPIYNGTTLAPFPNRLKDGRYEYAGKEYFISITEADKNNNLHGLALNHHFSLVAQTENSVELELELPPTTGYPFALILKVKYSLGENGLTETITAKNAGKSTLPLGLGFHPWFAAGGDSNKTSVELKAAKVVEVDSRCLPIQEVAVEDYNNGELNFKEMTKLDGVFVDHAFVELDDSNGLFAAKYTRADGLELEITSEKVFPAWQICKIPDAVAIEPGTCYADAFNTKDRLIELKQGESFTGSWSVNVL